MIRSFRIVGPVMNDRNQLPDGFLTSFSAVRREQPGEDFGWFFPFVDDRPEATGCDYYVVAEFPSRKAAEAFRKKWIAEPVTRAVDAELFETIVECCKAATQRAKERSRRAHKTKVKRLMYRKIQNEAGSAN